MEYTNNSRVIQNPVGSNYRLQLDPFKKVIRLVYNKSKGTTRITDRSVPVDLNTKWKFHCERTGYSEKLGDYNFIGSYIDGNIDPVKYQSWRSYVESIYRSLKS